MRPLKTIVLRLEESALGLSIPALRARSRWLSPARTESSRHILTRHMNGRWTGIGISQHMHHLCQILVVKYAPPPAQ